MKFQIVSDSSCDLPKERAQELGVDIVPFYVSFEEENYMKEGVDISVEDFYQMMADRAGTFPKTSMPSVQDYVDVFEKYAGNCKGLICVAADSVLTFACVIYGTLKYGDVVDLREGMAGSLRGIGVVSVPYYKVSESERLFQGGTLLCGICGMGSGDDGAE